MGKVLVVWLLVHVRGNRETEHSKLSCCLSVGCLWHKHVVVRRGAPVTSQRVSLGAGLWPPTRVREDALWCCVFEDHIVPSNTARKIIPPESTKRQQCSITVQMCADVKVCCVSGFCSYMIWNSLSSVTLPSDMGFFLSVQGKTLLRFYLMAGENG